MSKKEKNVKTNIKCDVNSCLHNNCDDNCCTLDEIKVSCDCNSDSATKKKETACESFKCNCDKAQSDKE